jgi:hypothetical protein
MICRILQELKVISRASVVRFRGRTVDPQTVGRELGVGSVLTGRFGKRGDSLLLAVELVNASDGRVLWSGQYSWASDRVSAIQSDIAGEVAQNLRVKVSAEEQRRLAERHTGDPEAYLLYLKGRVHAACGNRLEAERVLARSHGNEGYYRAAIYTALGDKNAAFEQLEPSIPRAGR